MYDDCFINNNNNINDLSKGSPLSILVNSNNHHEWHIIVTDPAAQQELHTYTCICMYMQAFLPLRKRENLGKACRIVPHTMMILQHPYPSKVPQHPLN